MENSASRSDGDTSAWPSAIAGVRATGGLALGGLVFGMLVGILATGRGIGPLDAILMGAVVFAGAAQVAVLEIWQAPLPYVAIALTAALVCTRHILMGVTLYDVLSRNRRWPPFGLLLLLTDASWVLTLRETRAPNRTAFFAGSGLFMYCAWMLGTVIGVLIPELLDATTIEGLHIGGPLFIAILLCIFFKGARPARFVAPVVSALVAVIANHWLGSAVALVAGVVAAALATLVRERLRRA